MNTKHNITGERFGKLVAVKPVKIGKNRELLWECKCDCGGVRVARTNALKRGATKSCGCLVGVFARTGNANRKHGLSGTPEYVALCDAIKRCEPTSKDRADYFDRGISVCKQWRDLATGIVDFIGHIGKRPSSKYSLDRINNNAGYAHGNVRWATRKTQLENRRSRLRIEQFSDKELLAEIAKRGLECIGGLAVHTVRNRSALIDSAASGTLAAN